MPGSRKPSETQQAWNNAGTRGMNKHALRQKQQIAGQRQMAPYEREPLVCRFCFQPRPARSFPMCEDCSRKRREGMR